MKKQIILILFSVCVVFVPKVAKSQWNCPSLLGEYTQPIGQSNFKAGLEIIGSAGLLDDNYYGFVSTFGALSYKINHHTFYVEGGFKGWKRYDESEDKTFGNNHAGFREAYYQYMNKQLSLRVGIQTMTMGDYYLVNDRALGFNLGWSFSNFKLQVASGSVMKQFSRNGLFCNVGYVYDILERDRGLMGNGFGQMNFASTTLTYNNKNITTGLRSVGLALYDEFGSRQEIKDTNVVMGGVYGLISLPFGINLMPEVLYQNAKNNNALLYSIGLRKIFMFENNTRLDCQARAIATTAIDDKAMIRNSFSNLFLGDVIRLEAKDEPLIQASTRYSIPRYSLHFKLQYTSQLKDYDEALSEVDLSCGKRINNLQLSLIGGYIKSQQLENKDCYLLRLEARLYLYPPKTR
ncbi:MAG: hypothetical protein LKE30_00915 [Bacteroidales bacterium]|jgi:hypothetical protein|nr:hypothetical protein [Bacteroidales bacterium]